MKKIPEFLSENFQFFGGEIFNKFEMACFRNEIAYVPAKTPDVQANQSVRWAYMQSCRK